ncbi:MAG: permease [Curvibacter sp. RIFCSPHIGHO2_12_FULL_63_18]|uniref:AEC family transporter n=1 Tax=Rhodoferax sp. TaxID=50421 RepID=UPI0008BA61EA|nr:AEC family transporter [Rhodoferax sp.]OGO95246.1 MAG: permease [Curvibacter sp. GWA2_63_95]OGP03383.1 MAG: permease [Curvibacter sp. RIFCSPHIGHO2_12_FULL_63_18]HCX81254.1 permease [Rhodoferax sp.]
MLDILAITGPIYLCIALGYLCTRTGVFSKPDLRVLGKFVLNLALPALLFNAIAQRPLRDVMHVDYLLAYGLGSLVMLLCSYLWARYVNRSTGSYRAFFAMGTACSNSGYMGYPVVQLVLGSIAPVALALNMLFENLIKLPVLLTLADNADAGGHRPWGTVLRDIARGWVRTPMLVVIPPALLVSVMGWSLPDPLARTITLFSQVTTGLALFVIGGALVGLRLKGKRRLVGQITFGKLVLHPLCVFLAFTFVVPIADPQLRTAALLFAAMPMLGVYPILALKYGHEEVSAATLLAATIGSFFTLNALLWGLKHYPL